MDRPAAARGFVLLEALVAVAIAALLMELLLQSFSRTWSNVRLVREDAEAMLAGRRLMTEHGAREGLSAGEHSGTMGGYGWTLQIAQLPTPAAQASGETKQPGPEQPAGATARPSDETRQTGQERAPRAWKLYDLKLELVTPTGRRLALETFRLGAEQAH
jgi:type II secretory pathway pseudopilin PulG